MRLATDYAPVEPLRSTEDIAQAADGTVQVGWVNADKVDWLLIITRLPARPVGVVHILRGSAKTPAGALLEAQQVWGTLFRRG